MKREDEEFCRARFDLFLRHFVAASDIVWAEVEKSKEPPDYVLTLENSQYAVEVTDIMEKVSVGSKSPQSHAAISRFLQKKIASEVEAIAKTSGYLRGEYLVSFSTPIGNLSLVWNEIQKELLEYIRNTGSLDEAPMKIVFERHLPEQRPQQCGIRKVSSKKDRIFSGGPVWAKWEGESEISLCNLLIESMKTKDDKLKEITLPKILLLLDEFVFADVETYDKCVSRSLPLHPFYTVFVVQDNKRGFVLYSENSNWARRRYL